MASSSSVRARGTKMRTWHRVRTDSQSLLLTVQEDVQEAEPEADGSM